MPQNKNNNSKLVCNLAYQSDPMNVQPKSAVMRQNSMTAKSTSSMIFKPQDYKEPRHQQQSGVLGFVIPKVSLDGNEKIQVISQGDPSLLEFAKLNNLKCPKEEFIGSMTAESSFSTIVSKNLARIPNHPKNLQANAVFIGQETKPKDKPVQEKVHSSKENLKTLKKNEHSTSNENRNVNRNKSKNNIKNKPKPSGSEGRLGRQKSLANKINKISSNKEHKEKLGTSREHHQAHGGNSGTNLLHRESAESKTRQTAKHLKSQNKQSNHQKENCRKKKDITENVRKSNTKLSRK